MAFKWGSLDSTPDCLVAGSKFLVTALQLVFCFLGFWDFLVLFCLVLFGVFFCLLPIFHTAIFITRSVNVL